MRIVGDLTFYRDVYGSLFSPVKGKICRGLLSILSGVLFIGLSGVLSDNAGAVSDYDDFVVVNKNLLYDNEGYCDLETHATSWYTGLTNNRFNRPYFDAMMQDYDDWLANDGGITIYSSGTYIHVIFTENKNDYGFGFQDLGSHRRLTLSNSNYNSSTPVWHAQLFRDPSWQNCTLYLQQASKFTNGFAQILFSDNLVGYPDTTGVFISDAHRNYPVGYEGQLIPETWSPPAPTYFDIPNIVALAGVDYKVNFQDKNYNTFDYVEGSCNDDLTPVISWIIKDSDDEVVESGYNSPTIQWEVQHPVIDESRNYTITGKYYCGDLESDPVFTDENVVEYSVDKNGLLNNKLIEDCFQDTFPFIDMGACIGNLKNALAFMSFNRFSFGTNLENAIPDNCHNLGTIGDWINAEGSNRIVCRRVPSEVREIVTPFVTLALGLVSLQFIASRGGGGF